MNRFVTASTLLAITALTTAAAADPTPKVEPDTTTKRAEGPAKLSLFTSAGYLSSSNANGAAISTGVRYAVGDHFALGLDLGYGLLALSKTQPGGTAALPTGMQDRWWIMPTMAVVIPTRIAKLPVTFDIGAGFGLGTSSGYRSWSTYAAQPFTADWAFQLVPTVRAHAIASVSVSHNVDVFLRADAAAMILPQNATPSTTDSTWVQLALGTSFRLL
jgi:hypothetical protein